MYTVKDDFRKHKPIVEPYYRLITYNRTWLKGIQKTKKT